VCTIVWACLFSNFLSGYSFFVCPQEELTFEPFKYIECDASDLVLRYSRALPEVFSYVGLTQINASSMEIHAIVLGFFAGFIAPFGGFFASGVKRAFKIKDFGDSIPGHGGMTDRMDCQLMMGMFTCVWLNSVVLKQVPSVQSVLNQISGLSLDEQHQILRELQRKISN